jgi:hypothetical protein
MVGRVLAVGSARLRARHRQPGPLSRMSTRTNRIGVIWLSTLNPIPQSGGRQG